MNTSVWSALLSMKAQESGRLVYDSNGRADTDDDLFMKSWENCGSSDPKSVTARFINPGLKFVST